MTPPPRRTRPGRRRLLRGLQLGAGVWTTVALVDVFAATPALADNCSAFSDCFGVAGSAVEAAFGLALLAGLSMVLDFVPGVGTAKGLVEAATGRDLLTGQELAPWERALGVLPVVGGLVAVGGLSRVARAAGDAPTRPPHVPAAPPRASGGAPPGATPPPARSAPAAGPRGYPGQGARYRYTDPKVQQYRDPATTPSQRRRLAEQIGEDGGLRYLREAGGNPQLTILRPTSSAQVQPLAERMEQGVAWDHAVAYNGRNVTNLVYFDGRTLHVVEAKGGNGQYIDRVSSLEPPKRIAQTDELYPRDVAADMQKSPLTDGRNELGRVIRRAYRSEDVRYVGVRTGPREQLLSGTPETVVEKIIKEVAG